jgi:lipopolysaccharide/colanic/teichoic acid biosynthesis glycosyltransferase
LVLTILLSLPMAVVAAVVKFVDGSPTTVRLTRVGINGRTFEMIKFRTMRQSAGASRAGGSPLTSALDSRVTALGKLLRASRVDEWPQLVNVLKGDMALIGPRPETPEYVSLDNPEWRQVLGAPPGIAGPTQLFARLWETALESGSAGDAYYRQTLLPAKLTVDSWYVQHASPRVDLDVLLALVRRPNANGRALERLKKVAPVPDIARPRGTNTLQTGTSGGMSLTQ